MMVRSFAPIASWAAAKDPHHALPDAPYFSEVAALLRFRHSPAVELFVGSCAWDLAERRRIDVGPGSALVLPVERDPADLRWPPLAELVIVVPYAHEFHQQIPLIRALARDGVRSVFIQYVDDETKAYIPLDTVTP